MPRFAMTSPRIQSKLWIDALLARVHHSGASAFISHKGEEDRGDILIKVAKMDGTARVLTKSIGLDGDSLFIDITTRLESNDEPCVDAYITTAKSRDCDLWVVEIEDKEGRHFLTEHVET